MSQPSPTNWDRYYAHPYRLARVTRYFTNQLLASLSHEHLHHEHPLTIVELGGGDSAFYPLLTKLLNYKRYVVVDNNQSGLDRMASQAATDSRLTLINHDIIQPVSEKDILGDLVFSVGLIEHFPADLTEQAVAAHFGWATDQGLIVIIYPTPTWLYRLSRWISERMGWWIFHDEVPLSLPYVAHLVRARGEILAIKINWFTPFTQAVIVARQVRRNIR